MRNEFCTLFDVNYLPRGLVLYRSLAETAGDFRLRVLCMDARTKALLDRLGLPRLETLALDELERHDTGLASVKGDRNPVEYCWTATPAICLYALEREPGLEGITYLDADLMFFGDPAPLFDEIGDASVAIVPHRYAPRWQHLEEASGVYNVEWVTFRRDDRGLEALRWWRDRCLEWCYDRVEDGKMGDQKYLDDWPERFAGVHVLRHPGGGLAPWNLEAHSLGRDATGVRVDGRPLVFFHYHALRLFAGTAPFRHLARWSGRFGVAGGPFPLAWQLRDYPLDARARMLVFEPYVRRLGEAIADLRKLEPGFRAGLGDLREELVGRVRRRAHTLAGRVPSRGLRGGWKRPDVAAGMLALAEEQLDAPESVPPYRAIVQLVEALADDDELADPALLVDVGCGTGQYGELLERTSPGRFAYTGVDSSEAMIEAARGRWPGRAFAVADVHHLDLDRYDVVLASALIDVLPDWERVLDVLLGSHAPYVLLHRQRMTEGRSRVETAAGYDGQRTYRTFLARGDLEAAARRHGRRIARSAHVEGEVESFLLVRNGR